jgi:hypothetical protein
MDKRLFDYDPFSGIRTDFHYDDLTDTSYLETWQDVEPILELNKYLQNHEVNGWLSKAREMRFVASIPNVIIEKWMNEKGINVFDKDHWPAVKRLLNDPEWRYLRTALGRL